MNKLVNIPLVRGDDPQASEAAEIINNIIVEIKRKGSKSSRAILYLGNEQHWAIRMLNPGTSLWDTEHNKFAGWSVVWVKRVNYICLAS